MATIFNSKSNEITKEFADSADEFPLDRWLQLGLVVTLELVLVEQGE